MIWNQWTLSLIIGVIILLIVVPLLLWVRFGKNGKKAFAQKNVFKKENKITELKNEIENRQKVITDLKSKKDQQTFEIKKHQKELIRLERELQNKQKDIN